MSVLYRARTRLLACCVVAVAALGALVFAPAAGAAKIGSTYLALGDSYAYGFHHNLFYEELGTKGFVEPETFNNGYVDDFGGLLKVVHPGLQVINDGCPGETTVTFVNGGCPTPKVFGTHPTLHHPYAGTQLADALAVLNEPGANVSPITLDIGGNDALNACGPGKPACTPTQIATLYGEIALRTGSILGQLRAAAPHASIVLLGYPNTFPTVVPDAAAAALNSALASAAASAGASFANPLPLFNPSVITGGPESQDIPVICAFTGMCPGGTFNPLTGDIHPSKLGYRVLAGVVALSFLTH
jgi:lysophospholipase L1-like esterase